jgi:hypothetical protein
MFEFKDERIRRIRRIREIQSQLTRDQVCMRFIILQDSQKSDTIITVSVQPEIYFTSHINGIRSGLAIVKHIETMAKDREFIPLFRNSG